MNKQNTIIIIFLLVLGLVGIYLLVSNAPTEDKENVPESTESEMIVENEDKNEEEEKYNPEDILDKAPDNSVKYEISGGTVDYIAQRRFLQQPDEEVIGVTEEVDGKGWFDFNTNSFGFYALLDFATIRTDDEKRDADVLELFDDSNMSIVVNVEDEESFVIDEEIELQIPATLTINGITRNKIFEVTTTVSEKEFYAYGTTTILMSEYGIEPPSLVKVFDVDDIINIEFEINGTSVNEYTENVDTATTDDMVDEDGTQPDTDTTLDSMELDEPTTAQEPETDTTEDTTNQE